MTSTFATPAEQAKPRPKNEHPVKAIGEHRLLVQTENGSGVVPFYLSEPKAPVRRVVIILHGRLRDADAYAASAQRALDLAGPQADDTLLLTPQFLADADVKAYRLPENALFWEWTGWMGGDDALGPAPISSFDVLDAVLAYCVKPGRFPGLKEVVIAGHSGGAQVAHRYAIVGDAADACEKAGVRIRYVIANPSSYVYFDAQRPDADGIWHDDAESEASRDQQMHAPACADMEHWKYGPVHPPRYAQAADFAALEKRYLARDVVYLLGQKDNDPAHEALDTSCAARSQGPHRLARGRAYLAYLARRTEGLGQTCHEIPGVGHNGELMLGSVAGLDALFDVQLTEDELARRRRAAGAAAAGAAD